VSRYQKGKTNLDFTEACDSEWQWHQLGHMQVCTLLKTDNHTSTPPLFFTGRMPFLPPNQHFQSISLSLCLCVLGMSVSPGKTAELIEMPFRRPTLVDPLNLVLDGMHIGASWRIQLHGGDAALRQITLTTCCQIDLLKFVVTFVALTQLRHNYNSWTFLYYISVGKYSSTIPHAVVTF